MMVPETSLTFLAKSTKTQNEAKVVCHSSTGICTKIFTACTIATTHTPKQLYFPNLVPSSHGTDHDKRREPQGTLSDIHTYMHFRLFNLQIRV